MASVEQRLVALENENKARKASYPVTGSLVKFISEFSRSWSRSSDGSSINVRIKFTPKINTSKSITTVRPQVSTNPNFTNSYSQIFYINEPQSSDGSIILNLSIYTPWFISQTYYFRAIATGSSSGSFSLL